MSFTVPFGRLRSASYEALDENRIYFISGSKFLVRPTAHETTSQIMPLALAHLLLDHLPAQAIPEVLECMANAWTFYARPAEVKQAAAASPKRLTGRITRAIERPSYAIPEE